MHPNHTERNIAKVLTVGGVLCLGEESEVRDARCADEVMQIAQVHSEST